MSLAMQSAMLAHPDKGLPPRLLAWPDTTDRQAFCRLNGRHRQHLIVKDLMQNLAIELQTPPTQPLPTAVITCAAVTPRLELSLDKANQTFWEKQVGSLINQKWHRADRMEEIVLQQTEILSFLTLGLPMAGDTHPWLTVLIDAVFDMAFRVVAELKPFFAMPRPHELSLDIAPVIRTPSHGAFPSGHATEAFAAAAVLSAAFPDYAAHVRQMAARIAMNRCYAGVHYAADQYAGALLGDVLGGLAIARVFGENPFTAVGTTHQFTAGATIINPGATVEAFALASPVLQRPAPINGPAASPLLSHLAALVTKEL